MTNAILIGYGRAGKRHGQILDELGIRWAFYDPYISLESIWDRPSDKALESRADSLLEAIKGFDFAVICTPPALHLSQIRQCLDAGLPCLCEKPLCALGQLDETRALLDHPNADKIMVAYNYRFHPKLQSVKGRAPMYLTCAQLRPDLPKWSLLLDHCSHDLDIIRFLRGDVEVVSATYIPPGYYNHDPDRQTWNIICKSGNEETLIREMVGTFDKRTAKLEYWQGDEVDIDPDPAMFTRMYEAFLTGEYGPGLEDAIKTQELLEKCQEIIINVSTQMGN